ncbi:MAG: helix-turn-helix domain-containing protein [bacterium]
MNSHVSEALDGSKIKEELRATLAKNIISARKAKAKVLGRTYTQEQLAEDSGHSTTAIAQIERGEVDPRLSTIAGIALALNVNPVFLLFGRSEIELLYQMIRELDEDSLSDLSERLFSDNLSEIEKLANSSLPKHRVKASQVSAATMALQLNKQLAQNAIEAAEAGQQLAESALDMMDESMKLGVSTSVGIGAAMAGIMGATVGAFMGMSEKGVSDLLRDTRISPQSPSEKNSAK